MATVPLFHAFSSSGMLLLVLMLSDDIHASWLYDIARTALDCPSPGEHLPHLAAHEGRLLKACLPQIANDILVNGSSSVVVFV